MNTVERWEFTRWSGNSPDAVKNAAMEVARLVYYRQREWPRREWGDIGQLETYSIAQLAKVIYPVLRDAWPQALAEQPEAGREEYHRCGKNIRRHKVSECSPQAQAAAAYTLRCLHEFARSMRHTAREAEKEQERLRDFAQANWFRGAQSAYSAMLKELDEIAEKQQEVSIGGQIRKIQPPVTIYKQQDGSGKTRIYLEDANSHLCQCETYEDAKGIAEALNGGRGDVR